MRAHAGPGFGARVVACEECILAREGMGPDQVLDPVRVQLDAAVLEEDAERLPALEDIADGLAHLAGAGQVLLLGAQPRAERVRQRLRPRLAGGVTLLGAAAADLGLDGVERGDAPERLFGHGRARFRRGIDQLAPRVGPALREHERSAALAVVPGGALVAGVAFSGLRGATGATVPRTLQDRFEACQQPLGMRTGAARGVGEHDDAPCRAIGPSDNGACGSPPPQGRSSLAIAQR